MGVLCVDPVDDHHFRESEFVGVIPYLGGADLDPVSGVDHDDSHIRNLERGMTLGDEVEVSGRVDDVETVFQPLGVQQRSVDGKLSLLFGFVIVGDRGAVRHGS